MLKLNWSMVKRFHDVAIRHQDAATILLGGCGLNVRSGQATEVMYLGGYAVECILKAMFLSRFRIRRHESIVLMFINEVRHNLDLLTRKLTKLKKKPVVIPLHLEKSLRIVQSQWSPNLRYNAKLTLTQDAANFMKLVDEIVEWSKKG